MEHLDNLGFNPWAFVDIKLVGEVLQGCAVVATFEVTGDAEVVERLRCAREQLPALRRQLVEPWRE